MIQHTGSDYLGLLCAWAGGQEQLPPRRPQESSAEILLPEDDEFEQDEFTDSGAWGGREEVEGRRG